MNLKFVGFWSMYSWFQWDLGIIIWIGTSPFPSWCCFIAWSINTPTFCSWRDIRAVTSIRLFSHCSWEPFSFLHLCEYTALHVSVFFGAMALVLSHPVVKTGPGDGHYIHFACDTMPGKCTQQWVKLTIIFYSYSGTNNQKLICVKNQLLGQIFVFCITIFVFPTNMVAQVIVVISENTQVISVALQVFCFVGKQILEARGRCTHEPIFYIF